MPQVHKKKVISKRRKRRTRSPLRATHIRLESLGIFQIQDSGLSRWKVARLAEKGELIRVARGYYYQRDADVDLATLDFSVACLKLGPQSVIGGMSALFHYVLVDRVPTKVWVVVPHSERAKFPEYRVLHTKHKPRIGVENHVTFRITSIERTIVEAFVYATKIGLETAIGAARTAIRDEKTTAAAIWKMAETLGRVSTIRRHWEAVTTR